MEKLTKGTVAPAIGGCGCSACDCGPWWIAWLKLGSVSDSNFQYVFYR